MRRTVKIIALAMTVIALCTFAVACSTSDSSYKEPTGKAYYDYKNSATNWGTEIWMRTVEREIGTMKADDFVQSSQQSDYVLIKVKDYGDIVVLLRHDVAPKTVENFKSLVADGYYNGTVFHRVIKGFMIQGGGSVIVENPDGEGKLLQVKESGTKVEGEFKSNGFENNLKHVRGVISMARVGGDKNSATSQFFIVHENGDSATNLNGEYASFGYVLAGLDVVDAIANCLVFDQDGESPLPVFEVTIESITFVEPK